MRYSVSYRNLTETSITSVPNQLRNLAFLCSVNFYFNIKAYVKIK